MEELLCQRVCARPPVSLPPAVREGGPRHPRGAAVIPQSGLGFTR